MKKTLLASLFAVGMLFTSCTSSDDNNEKTCEDRIQDSAEAAIAFASATDDNYVELCNAYKVALQLQIQDCGDSSSLQETIDEVLGDCVPVTSVGSN